MTADVELAFSYDANNQRVLKTAADNVNNRHHTVYAFASLELRRTVFEAGDYVDDKFSEVAYLFAHGVRVARLHYSQESLPTLTSGKLHVLLELPDHLGSSSIVVDRETGELVERSTYLAQGSADSDYRSSRWDSFREDYRFTGKEADVEIGVAYFGARFYSVHLGRWVSPDPLALHTPMKGDGNLYAYVHGRLLAATDPLGLDYSLLITKSTITVKMDIAVSQIPYSRTDPTSLITNSDITKLKSDAQEMWKGGTYKDPRTGVVRDVKFEFNVHFGESGQNQVRGIVPGDRLPSALTGNSPHDAAGVTEFGRNIHLTRESVDSRTSAVFAHELGHALGLTGPLPGGHQPLPSQALSLTCPMCSGAFTSSPRIMSEGIASLDKNVVKVQQADINEIVGGGVAAHDQKVTQLQATDPAGAARVAGSDERNISVFGSSSGGGTSTGTAPADPVSPSPTTQTPTTPQ